jgi:two-component system sensor histidine kinase MtrB
VVTVDSNETAVALAVRDYGIGMSQQDVNHVFDRFWRADPSRKRTLGGTGLGLAISLEDATLHSGWLQVWSMPAQGSCFRLTLPRFTGKGIIASPLPLPPVDAGTKPVPPESSEPDDTGALDRVAPALGSAPLPGSEARA